MVCVASVDVEHPQLLMSPTISSRPDLTLRSEYYCPTPAGESAFFFAARGSDLDGLAEDLRRDPTVAEPVRTVVPGPDRVFRVAVDPTDLVVWPHLAELNLHVSEAQTTASGWRFTLRAGGRDPFSEFSNHCDRLGVDFRLNSISDGAHPGGREDPVSLRFDLTARQYEVARRAIEMGYFGGDATTEEIAAALDISPSTLSEHLKTVQEKVFVTLFGDDNPPVPAAARQAVAVDESR